MSVRCGREFFCKEGGRELKRCAIEGGKVHSAARQKVSGKRFFREAAGRMV